ncbi:flagellar hook-associated protein FlgK [Falsirhodobacter halotolerans]|uniref:flagellar hook-associated protein FlgK n=1 Tax=Falsirhodobacter halotolerans TaxID=1146892 RepID=UPI001FD38AF7|nr:flagellar hook-associated protein FlgK [Falsirhodobacter halotolerans]MCJ8140734.1 flagellar hook-associated protein FlgK [Falsirhodobacter halotolerans]
MTLGSALSVARSGLTASARLADITAQNVANALTEGYGRREVTLSARAIGGVEVTGITRFADRALIADRRMAEGSQAGTTLIADFFKGMEAAVGASDAPGSLSQRVSAVETALIDAANQPQSAARLDTAVAAGAALADKMNDLRAQVQDMRLTADRGVAAAVADLNAALAGVEALNDQIAGLSGGGRDVSALLDQRQTLVDRIAGEIPVRELVREDGRIALYTSVGAALLDGPRSVLGFTPVMSMTADMTVEGGALSGVTLNGRPMGPSSLGDGALGARLTVRDTHGVEAASRLAAMAGDLTDRLGPSGLVTEGAGGRLAVDPRLQASWRLRDGLTATAPGAPGDGTRLNAALAALTGASGAAAEVLSSMSARRVRAEEAQDFSTARFDTLKKAELAQGVDTDSEMQTLLKVEQAYTANARVVQTIDQMMQRLLEL